MERKIESLIFSKNRPMQLELCLRSHKHFWGENITVLFKADPEYQKGYEILAKEYPEVNFLPETNFKQQVIEYVKRNKYTVFFCDDDVMIRPMEQFEHLLTDKIACVSMRLDPKYTWHFERDMPIEKPLIHNNTWVWSQSLGDWSFPMSVLGHIFRSSDLLPLVTSLIYTNPNQLEAALAENPIPQPLMVCFNEAKNINLPLNLVQNVFPNKAGKVSVKKLNDRFLAGERISLTDIIQKVKKARSCFMVVSLTFYNK